MLYGNEKWHLQKVVMLGWMYWKEIFTPESVAQLKAVVYDVLYIARNGVSYIRIQVWYRKCQKPEQVGEQDTFYGR